MTSLEIRLIAYALVALVLLGGSGWLGYHLTAAHYERVIASDKAAQALALQGAQQRVIDAQAALASATQKAEQQYADLKTSYDALSNSLADSVREYTALHSLIVSTVPGATSQSNASTPRAGGDTELADAAGHAAQACLDDAAHLAALQTWIGALK